jgi:hypothetical protein
MPNLALSIPRPQTENLEKPMILRQQINKAVLNLECLFDQATAHMRDLYCRDLPFTDRSIADAEREIASDRRVLLNRCEPRGDEQKDRIDQILQVLPQDLAASLLLRLSLGVEEAI